MMVGKQLKFAVVVLISATFARAVAADDALSTSTISETIRVKPVIELSGTSESITLADLIVAPRLSATARSMLTQIHLADAPKAGETRSFTDVGLSEIFQTQAEAIEAKTGEHLNIEIPARVLVSKKKFSLNANQVEKELLNQFKQLCADCQFEISGMSVPLIGETFGDQPTWAIRPRTELPKGGFSIPLELTPARGGAPRTFWISGTLSTHRKVAVLSRVVETGEHLRTEDFTWQEKDVTFSMDFPATQGEIDSSVTARQIAAGQIIFRGELRRELAIHNGDGVKVVAGSDDWQITIEGIAQTSGYVGDLIRVKIPRTQKTISGLLREKGTVEVQ